MAALCGLRDVLVELLRLGHSSEPQLLGGDEPPAARILVTRDDLAARPDGIAFIDGQTAPVSITTAERHLCASGSQRLEFDEHGRPLDVGRASRLFTRRQRRALAARDGGCMFPACERPTSWTEAHHINHWVRDRGGSDIDDGILLCRHHHRLVHDQGWEFQHSTGSHGISYAIIPPRTIDAAQRPVPLPSRSAAYRRLRKPVDRRLRGAVDCQTPVGPKRRSGPGSLPDGPPRSRLEIS